MLQHGKREKGIHVKHIKRNQEEKSKLFDQTELDYGQDKFGMNRILQLEAVFKNEGFIHCSRGEAIHQDPTRQRQNSISEK